MSLQRFKSVQPVATYPGKKLLFNHIRAIKKGSRGSFLFRAFANALFGVIV